MGSGTIPTKTIMTVRRQQRAPDHAVDCFRRAQPDGQFYQGRTPAFAEYNSIILGSPHSRSCRSNRKMLDHCSAFPRLIAKTHKN